MVEKAKSGHPGGAMGGADFITVLFTEFLRYDPDNMAYPYRDRFFLDPGHMSPMLYATLSLAGHYSTEDLQSLRQWGSVTPGHPEVDVMRGVENTSGPLGQGHAMALGAAIAERFMAARFGEWMAHKTYAYISDGAVEEEISQGVGRIAGHLGLSNFVMYYDSNNIQLSTKVDEVMTENVAMKYEAWGWNVLSIDGHNINEIREALVAAVQNGADAVYMGFGAFNARRSARNFSDEEFRAAVSSCHLRGVKVYLTLNTLVTDRELSALAAEARTASECGVDAILVQDWGVLATLQKIIPDVPLHASTQMTLHTAAGCEFARRLGYTRTVLSRELPADVIKELCKQQNMEIEIFVHGALCMSVSGQCLMSAVVGGRSANRGICAQPCRLPCSVKKGRQDHVLSLKDMSILHDLPELAEFGVDSLKIEGRMKRPEYSALSAYCAKKALAGEDYDERLLADVFSRGGFTDGYLKRAQIGRAHV